MAKKIPKISGMDWVVEQLSQLDVQPDEFTTEMVIGKTTATRASIRHRLKRMCESGKLTSRKILLNGSISNVYKRASPA